MLPDWAVDAVTRLGIGLKDDFGNGDCALKSVKTQWTEKELEGRPPTRKDVIDELRRLCQQSSVKSLVLSLAIAVTDDAPVAATRTGGRLGEHADATLNRYFTKASAAQTHFDEAMMKALTSFIVKRGIGIEHMSLNRAYPSPSLYPVDTVKRVLLIDDGSGQPIQRDWSADDIFKIKCPSIICLATVQDSAFPGDDHIVEFGPAMLRASKAAAISALTSQPATFIFNEDTNGVYEFDAVRKSSAHCVQFRTAGTDDQWWAAHRNSLSMLTIPAVEALENNPPHTVFTAKDGVDSGKDLAADPTWAIPGHYSTVTCRTTTLTSSCKCQGHHLLFKAVWRRGLPPYDTVHVVLDKFDLPVGSNVQLLCQAGIDAGGKWCAARAVSGPGQSRAMPLDIRLQGSSRVKRWAPGLCLPSAIAMAMRWRGDDDIAQQLWLRFKSKEPIWKVIRWLSRSSVVTSKFDIFRLRDRSSVQDNPLQSILTRRGRREVVAVWIDEHAVAIDMELHAVLDAQESSPLVLPDSDHEAQELLLRLTASGATSQAQVMGGVVLARRQPSNGPRRRGKRGGKCKKRTHNINAPTSVPE